MFRSNHLRAAGQSAQCPLPFAVDQQHDTLRGLGRRAGSRICGINYKAPPQLVRVDLKGHLGGFADSLHEFCEPGRTERRAPLRNEQRGSLSAAYFFQWCGREDSNLHGLPR